VRYNTQAKLNEAFPDENELQKQALGNITELPTAGEFQHYLRSLEPYLAEFAHVTENQVKKLFPKIKKLKVPDVTSIDFRYVTFSAGPISRRINCSSFII
jgi:hypothetical protein